MVGSAEAARGYRVVLENDNVRVLELLLKSKDVSKMHSHPPHVTVALGNFGFRSRALDGSVRTLRLKKGEVEWSDATVHEVENIGGRPGHAIVVELKQ
jgi:beta-alanine degradation protein BauB